MAGGWVGCLGCTAGEEACVQGPEGWTLTWVLPSTTSAPSQARALVEGVLLEHGLKAHVFDLVLWTSELVTNAVTHAPRRAKAPVVITLSYCPLGDRVTLTAVDSNGKHDKHPPAPDQLRGPEIDEAEWDGMSPHVGLGLVQFIAQAGGGDLDVRRLGACNIVRAWMCVAVALAAAA